MSFFSLASPPPTAVPTSLTPAPAPAIPAHLLPISDSESRSTTDTGEDVNFCARLPLTDTELFSPQLSSAEILGLVAKVVPALSVSTPAIAQLSHDIAAYMKIAPPLQLPRLVPNPTTWPQTNPAMDEMWTAAVNAESALIAAKSFVAPTGVDMRPQMLVKLFGSLDDPLLVLSSYPTADPLSTVHMEYGVCNDLSNTCMGRLYTKLGFHLSDFRTTGMLQMDIFPRRLDRKLILGPQTHVLSRMPPTLLAHWQDFVFRCLDQSKAKVVIASGRAAHASYKAYLKYHRIHHDNLWL